MGGSNSDAGMRTNETDIQWPDRKETVEDAGMRTNETDIRWPDRKETVGVATSTGPMPTTFASRKITVEVILIHVFITQHPAFHEHVVCSFNEHGPTKQDA